MWLCKFSPWLYSAILLSSSWLQKCNQRKKFYSYSYIYEPDSITPNYFIYKVPKGGNNLVFQHVFQLVAFPKMKNAELEILQKSLLLEQVKDSLLH